MRIKTVNDLKSILSRCRAVAIGVPSDGGKFYHLMKQEFRYPDGSMQPREYLDKKHASVVVPVTDDGYVVFVIQPIGLAKEGSLVECPAGYWDFGEDGKEAAERELTEETGYTAEKVVYTGMHYQDPGSIRQSVDTYIAFGATRIGEQKLDRGEYIEYVEVPVECVPCMLANGLIKDANTFIALVRAAQILEWDLTL